MSADALEAAGLNVRAALPAEDYDRIVPPVWRVERVRPGSRSVQLVGNGGRALWDAFTASPERQLKVDPLDGYLTRVLTECVGDAFAPYWAQRDGRFLPLLALASAAGLGTLGRVGVLLHPDFGPWLSLRAAVYLDEEAPEPVSGYFDPCPSCPAPCVTACHGDAIGVSGRDTAQCLATKLRDLRCRSGCDARSACVLAPEHAFTRDEIVHHEQLRAAP